MPGPSTAHDPGPSPSPPRRAVARRAALAGVLLATATRCAAPPAREVPPPATVERVTPADTGAVEITILDVGQGDAAVVRTPEGRVMLVDAGPDRDAVARALRTRGIDTVDLAVASHGHADHLGGMAAVLSRTVVRAYLDDGAVQPTALYRRTLDALEASRARHRTRVLQAKPRTVALGSVAVRVLAPPAGGDADSQNDRSVGLLVERGAFRMLFAGDAERAERAAWLGDPSVAPGGRIPAVVLKVAHHGSENGTDAAWLDAVAPTTAVISVGARNEDGHPSPRVLQALAARRIRVLRTDRHGDIVIAARADGTFTVTTHAAPRTPAAAAATAGGPP